MAFDDRPPPRRPVHAGGDVHICTFQAPTGSLTLGGVRKVPLRLVTGVLWHASVRHPSDLESAHTDAGAARLQTPRSVVAIPLSGPCSSPPPSWSCLLFCCRSGTDAVFSSCCCTWTTARYEFGDDGVDLATVAGGTSPSRAANRSHIARATGTNESLGHGGGGGHRDRSLRATASTAICASAYKHDSVTTRATPSSRHEFYARVRRRCIRGALNVLYCAL